MHWRRKWQPTPVFLPGESQGRGSLAGCRLWGHTELDTTESTKQQQQQQHLLCWMSSAYGKSSSYWHREGACHTNTVPALVYLPLQPLPLLIHRGSPPACDAHHTSLQGAPPVTLSERPAGECGSWLQTSSETYTPLPLQHSKADFNTSSQKTFTVPWFVKENSENSATNIKKE